MPDLLMSPGFIKFLQFINIDPDDFWPGFHTLRQRLISGELKKQRDAKGYAQVYRDPNTGAVTPLYDTFHDMMTEPAMVRSLVEADPDKAGDRIRKRRSSLLDIGLALQSSNPMTRLRASYRQPGTPLQERYPPIVFALTMGEITHKGECVSQAGSGGDFSGGRLQESAPHVRRS